ncbi:MAG: nitroreductase family protein [Salinivirgaceae bacterium]
MTASSKLRHLVEKNRSYRRFNQTKNITRDQLIELVDLARLSASARNQQALKFYLSNTEAQNQQLFECLAWAGYLKDWSGPIEGERPAAYIVICNDTTISKNHFCDEGIASQSILLGAVEMGLGGCMIAAINKPKLTIALNLPEELEILLVLALGEPVEQVVIDEIKQGDYKYWRDTEQVHHVPKRSLEELIINSQHTTS